MKQIPHDVAQCSEPGIAVGRVKPTLLPEFWCEPGGLTCGVRSVAATVLRCWLHVYERLTIVGRQNLPADRSFILVANHASHLDTLCLLSALPIQRLHSVFPVAARDYFCVNRLRAFLAKVVFNVMPFDRHASSCHSLRECARLLQKPETILVLFPEGMRTSGSEPGEFKPGVGYLTAGQDIPVVPCHLSGTHAALPKGTWCPRPKAVRLTVGEPRVYARLPATKASRRHICRELREAVMLLGRARFSAC